MRATQAVRVSEREQGRMKSRQGQRHIACHLVGRKVQKPIIVVVRQMRLANVRFNPRNIDNHFVNIGE